MEVAKTFVFTLEFSAITKAPYTHVMKLSTGCYTRTVSLLLDEFPTVSETVKKQVIRFSKGHRAWMTYSITFKAVKLFYTTLMN